ncbi:CheR family methyltransferase [Sideroxydans lithotrophicus]|uniref:Chemotaxis protein methyltransferase n=1 Tax=Sideroxydans lithotrophicus (strain ES-1) TaxID=580332 RepID=D5CMV7_SIDLE|nr:CheR family methyltransferase [Sideroxydans lithotrophicus]ADE10793.1 MCP methyltransferase, CheR-type [Sideroxydans lithotrophicus ES-1]
MNSAHPREFQFTDQDFQRIRKLIHQHAGIALGENKQELVYSRLARRLRATGIKSFGEYLDLLQCGDEVEWESFTNSLTTNLTSFFREPHHFSLLGEHLRKQDAARPLTLWCSACSTGEEAYSMAMTAVETLGGGGRQVHIIASDLDTKVLQTAREGRYRVDAVAKLPAQQVERFFLHDTGEQADFVRVRPELQRMIDFRRINLLDDEWPIHAPLDAIFCRNVMIYFDKPTQLAILKKFAPLLRDNGLLFAGHSENFYHAGDWFKLRGHTVYELAVRPQGR